MREFDFICERSKLIPLIPGECHSERHQRRRRINFQNIKYVSSWCNENGAKIVTHMGVWNINKGNGFARWSPGTGKLFFSPDSETPMKLYKVFDWEQLIGILDAEWLGQIK